MAKAFKKLANLQKLFVSDEFYHNRSFKFALIPESSNIYPRIPLHGVLKGIPHSLALFQQPYTSIYCPFLKQNEKPIHCYIKKDDIDTYVFILSTTIASSFPTFILSFHLLRSSYTSTFSFKTTLIHKPDNAFGMPRACLKHC